MPHDRTLAVIGLGYVGLPVAAAFARSGARVIGFDIDDRRVAELRRGFDRTGEVAAEGLGAPGFRFSSDPADLKQADFFIVAVPTPVDDAKRPDLTALAAASRSVGAALKPGDIVVYESTVYPGATEEECIPRLEAASGLKAGRDFTVGYSPERINPGDERHRFETIVKVVSAQDEATCEIIAGVYGSVVKAGIHRAPSIKVAEAAKVIENTQRDLNIAFVNELSEIFSALEIDTNDVLEAAGTKWNFLKFTPGLVGGHCVGVDPYYLTHRAIKAGYHPEVILAGRRVNDNVGRRVTRECVRKLLRREQRATSALVFGLSFKEDVADIRNSKAADIVCEMLSFGLRVQVHDPLADPEEVRREYGFELTEISKLVPSEAVILAVPHAWYVDQGWSLIRRHLADGSGVVCDVKGTLDRAQKPAGVDLIRL